MSEASTHQRLLECLRAVFPGDKDDVLATASATTHPDWDSVAQVTLITLVEEEFKISVQEDQYGELTSFEAMLAYLETGA